MNYAIADTMILDNGQSGTSHEGAWWISNGVEPYASNSLYASTDDASYTFTFDLATPGEYQVFARWTDYHNRRSTVPYDIIHKSGTNTVIVNQQQNGGTWQKLGSTWTFGSQATIRIRSLGNGTTSADAIKLVYVQTNTALESDVAADTLILDNDQSGTSHVGPWWISNGVEPYASNSLYASTVDASYTFTFDLATPGEYQVFARWTEYHNRRSTVPYDIVHKTGTNTVIVNQQQNGGTWQKLGSTWTFGNQATIRIRSLGNGTTSVDAIKLVYVQTETALESIGAAQTGSVVLNWTAPVARADGTPLALSEIADYTIYYGTVENNYPNAINIKDGSATSISITGLPLGTYYMVATTRDYDGRESMQSGMVTKQVK